MPSRTSNSSATARTRSVRPDRSERSGIGVLFGLRLQQVSEATDGLDLQIEGLKAPPQSVNGHLDGGVRQCLSGGCQAAGDLILLDDPAGALREQFEQCELTGRQINRGAVEQNAWL